MIHSKMQGHFGPSRARALAVRIALVAPMLISPILGSLGGCARAPASAPAKPDQVYTVRARVAEIPVPGKPQTEFKLHHEAIDDFVDGSGKTVGMSSMVMSFTFDKAISPEGLAPGDLVEATFAVWWKGEPPLRYPDYKITAIKKLPDGAKLEFREARPPATPAPAVPPAGG